MTESKRWKIASLVETSVVRRNAYVLAMAKRMVTLIMDYSRMWLLTWGQKLTLLTTLIASIPVNKGRDPGHRSVAMARIVNVQPEKLLTRRKPAKNSWCSTA